MIEESRRIEDGAAPEVLDVPSMFPLLFDQLADSVYVTDAEGTIQYVNHAFELATGYSREEAIGQTPRILKSGIHPREVYEELWTTVQGGTPFRFIFGNRKKDGEIYEEGVMISPIRGIDGKTSHYLSMGRVINAFRQNYDVFTLLANSAPAAIYLQRDGKVFFVNEHLTTTLGYSPDELLGREWLELVVDEDRTAVREHVARMLKGELEAPFEYRIAMKDGSIRWLMATVRRVVFRGIQSVAGDFVAGYLTDITDRKDAEERLQRALSMYAATVESTTDGIIVLDNERNLVSHNRLFTEMWKLGDIPNQGEFTTRGVLAERMKNPDSFKRAVEEAWATPTSEKAGTVELLDGRYMEFYSKPQIVDNGVVGRVWSWRDVTERRRIESALLRLANQDAVTGLLSRRKLQEEIEHCLSSLQDSNASLLLLDLDGFKDVNDTFGHQAGDQVLIQVGNALTECGCGDIIGRFGGDEFAIFLPGCDQEAALAAADRVLKALSTRTYMASGSVVSLSGSIGVAVYPDSGRGADELLSAADLAMYEAKDSGRGRVHVYSPRLRQRSRLFLRGDWQAQMRHAIESRVGKLYAQETVALQPGVSDILKLSLRMGTGHGKVVSVQDLGPLAEQAGLSLALDGWLLDEAVVLARRLAASGSEPGLALDLSGASLGDAGIIDRLLALSEIRSRTAGALVLEIAEVRPVPRVRAAIQKLHKAGYAFKVADRTPQRLLEVMRSMPIGYIEIDASIAAHVAKDPAARALASGVVLLAHSIGAGTLAYGVRDAATMAALRELGVDHARGRYTGRARPAATLFADRLASRAA